MRTAPVGGVAVTLMCPVCQAGLVFAVVLCFFLKEAVSDDRMRNESFLLWFSPISLSLTWLLVKRAWNKTLRKGYSCQSGLLFYRRVTILYVFMREALTYAILLPLELNELMLWLTTNGLWPRCETNMLARHKLELFSLQPSIRYFAKECHFTFTHNLPTASHRHINKNAVMIDYN